MTRQWEAWVAYDTGEVVEYQGQKFRIAQSHTSQSGWIPGVSTSALYQRLGSEEHREPPQQCQASRGVYEHSQVPAQIPDSLERWMKDARKRADEFRRSGPRAPTTWVLVKGHESPGGAVEAGKEGGRNIYGFPFHKRRQFLCVLPDAFLVLNVGKAGKHLRQGAEIGRQHMSHAFNEYEILVGPDPRAVR
ncbi:hypothetical protein BJ322DRAFT_1024388 [Thelephora terrestris]|uniref:Chitin-binding type-3 domain-containing protein n=1 Tax=Thelephora terrestris TaxID=56493 RepID=A0A9P6H4S4_9AGAM|nr:hypothetical protein BJ322DRAFT_1024388 [Thelephora terrestris]